MQAEVTSFKIGLKMKCISTKISDVRILIPSIFKDERGFFLESYNQKSFVNFGIETPFVQDNHSHSQLGVLRGLHFQLNAPQGKLVRVTSGKVFDVAVDLRKSSPTYGQWIGEILSAENHKMLWIPPHFAHGFMVLSPSADVLYKTTEFYDPKSEYCLKWDDPTVAIEWPNLIPILSEKDQQGALLQDLKTCI